MNKKIFYGALLILAVILFATTYVFATDNNAGQDAVNDIRNAVGGAENTVENAARDVSNASKDATGAVENAGNQTANNVENAGNQTANNVENNASAHMGTDDSGNTAGYTATRTSTGDNATFLGMNSTMWIWLILAIAAVAIVALVYYYSTQTTNAYENSDD